MNAQIVSTIPTTGVSGTTTKYLVERFVKIPAVLSTGAFYECYAGFHRIS